MSESKRPPPASERVRLEAFVVPAPSPLGLGYLALLEAIPMPVDVCRLPVDLMLVVDRSSSMSGRRFRAAVEAVRQIGLRLDSRDRLGVVAFDEAVRVVLPPTLVTPGLAEEAALQLGGLGVGLGTNLGAGYRVGRDLLGRGGPEGVSKTLILLSDGLPSVGETRDERLVELARRSREYLVATDTVGVGAEFNEDLLSAMATAGGGAFRFVASDHDIVATAEEAVNGLATLVGDRAALHIELAPAERRWELLHSLEHRLEDGRIVVSLGRLLGGVVRPVLLHLEQATRLPGSSLGHARLVFRSVGSVGSVAPGESPDALPRGAAGGIEATRLLPASPPELPAAQARVGSALVPLLIARGIEGLLVYDRQDRSPDWLSRELSALEQQLALLPAPLRAHEDARLALARFAELAARLRDAGTPDGALRKEMSTFHQMVTTGRGTVGPWTQ